MKKDIEYKKDKNKNKVYRLTDQLVKLMLDPNSDIDTEMLIYYIKSKLKKDDKKRDI